VLTPAGLVREGNALTNTAFSLAYLAGPVLVGVIALNLASTRGLRAAPKQRAGSGGRLRAALAHVRDEAALRGVMIVQFLAMASVTIATPVEAIYAEHSLHAGSTGYGVLLTAWGGGTVIGSAIFARYRARSARAALAVAGAGGIGAGLVAWRTIAAG
jgi:hypothetical protein